MAPLTALALPLLRRMEAERAHRLAILAMRLGFAAENQKADPLRLGLKVAGMTFKNPIGLAAGFDKDAVALRSLMRMGFGFVEAGTVTPLPQAGNPEPRLFRLTEDQAIINRMGFNNKGIKPFERQLARHRRIVPVGANIGVNKEGADPERDYPELLRQVAPVCNYVVVNVSSPNTPGLRDLQSEERIAGILAAMRAAVPDAPPIFVKLAPDLSVEGMEAVIEVAVNAGIAGLILTNTTTARPDSLRSPHATETGGLSGRPLFTRSTAMLARASLAARGRLALIGVGGVASGADALAKIHAGADLVQVYTAFIYQGPKLIARIKADLDKAVKSAGVKSIAELKGIGADALAKGI
ncbi:quinone-dependent dihydroorotate dehydrogenase [Acidisoma cellulosilytica]|uniref:Dihydroorotate dehydrogenase (quinone) n=1 Tax=Acidisoma cellulosilyticum TaxID=2802395 RepID=A0A963Z477_9PROT|nr:quinone-dependent dihydroorotate dehydrogenase [Acidisoma cellulosilyticum]MCB8882472.1 quinone-dependent dihydroorotate dehydrogenase [Acidisoma cellulosilyticum]